MEDGSTVQLSGDSRDEPPAVLTELAPESDEPLFTISPISGFWRRFAAFILDGLLLGVVGQALGWSLSSFWFEVGPYGRIVGQMIALLYFGLMDSRIGNGQTLGKRLLKVAVRDSSGTPIGVGRSMLRTLIWLVPTTLNGWAVPIMANMVVASIATVILFGVGGAVLVTMIFNQRTRQGLHDMLTHTYVLRLSGEPVESLPSPAKLQWILTGIMIALALAVVGVGGIYASRSGTPLQSIIALQQTLQEDERFFSVSVFDQTFSDSDGETSRALRVEGWYKGMPSDAERETLVNELAREALAIEGVEEFDLIRVDVKSAYDLGIATAYLTYGDGQTVDEWRKRTGQ